MRFWKCEFCEKWDFENVNFVENEILKMWILRKIRLWNCEFCEKWDFQNVNFSINWGFLPHCGIGNSNTKRGEILRPQSTVIDWFRLFWSKYRNSKFLTSNWAGGRFHSFDQPAPKCPLYNYGVKGFLTYSLIFELQQVSLSSRV